MVNKNLHVASEIDEEKMSTKISGIRPRNNSDTMDKIREQIVVFRQEKFASGFFSSMDGVNDAIVSDDGDFLDVENQERECMNDDVLKKIIIKNCGSMYWDFLDSGHPLARFWVQLKNGIEVIPRSEYVYYIQSILEKKVEGIEAIGSSRVKEEFMRKYGFESDGEVEEYLTVILREADVENMIAVE